MKKETLREAVLMLDEDLVTETMEKRAALEAAKPRKKKTPVQMIGRVAAIAAAVAITVVGGGFALRLLTPLNSKEQMPDYGNGEAVAEDVLKETLEANQDNTGSYYMCVRFELDGGTYEIRWDTVLSSDDMRSFETAEGTVQPVFNENGESISGALDGVSEAGTLAVRRYENGEIFGFLYGKWYAAQAVRE